MPDKPFGAAQPIADVLKKGYDALTGLENAGAPKQSDTSWHDSKVAEANQSFANHQVHEIKQPQGHGYIDQKYGKGNISPISSSVPTVK